MHIVQPDLAILHAGVAFAQVDLARSYGLDLGTGQRDAGLNGVQDLVVVERLAIGGKDALWARLRRLALGAHAGLWRATPDHHSATFRCHAYPPAPDSPFKDIA